MNVTSSILELNEASFDAAADPAGGVRVAKVNVDQAPHLAALFRVQAIPLLVLLRDGREVARFVGLQPKASLAAAIARFA